MSLESLTPDNPAISDLPAAQIEHATRVGPKRALGPGVLNREVIAPADLRANSPFILLVEDFIQPQDSAHEHPHRGFETVSFVLSGEMAHRDHLGDRGVSLPGDVQWMTAGSGIVHGGGPANGSHVHMLQLWLNLPNALRNAPPGARPQTRAQARLETGQGMTMRVYGDGSPGQWSRYPMTLRDIASERGGSIDVLLPVGRSFVYLVAGDAEVAGRRSVAGDVLRLALVAKGARLAVSSDGALRMVVISGEPIDEPVFVHGPFAAGSAAELHQAFADWQSGTLLQGAAIVG